MRIVDRNGFLRQLLQLLEGEGGLAAVQTLQRQGSLGLRYGSGAQQKKNQRER
jgi:DNA polymerase III delta subunit